MTLPRPCLTDALIQITSCFYPLILFFFSLILIRLGFIWPNNCAGWFKCFLSFLFLNVIGGFAPCSKLSIFSCLDFPRFWNILFLSKQRICTSGVVCGLLDLSVCFSLFLSDRSAFFFQFNPTSSFNWTGISLDLILRFPLNNYQMQVWNLNSRSFIRLICHEIMRPHLAR